MIEFEWTRFWFNISHIKNIPKRYQITINKWDNGYASVYFIDREVAAFTDVKEYQGTIDNCKRKGEEWATKIWEDVK